MKKVLAWVLLFVLVLGMFAGCKKDKEEPTTPDTTPASTASVATEPQGPTAQDAIEYLCAMYPDTEEPTKTPVNYDRYGIVRIAGIPFTIVWTVDVTEDLVKVVVNEDGNVTIDVNEACEVATPYTLTATITDEYGNTATHSWDMILPSIGDMIEIVKAAYALAPGESLPYESTLRGKIISIDSVYNPEYKNITVTIVVEGAEDMPIECYRMKGEGCENLLVGNIITVTGTLKNYNGTIEFDSGCMLVAVEQGDAVAPPTDTGEILKAAYALPSGQSLPYPVTLTGKVTEIDSPYDANYGNLSVIMVMEGYPNYPVLCYRLKGADADLIARGDTITVTGIIKNYKGTIEFDTGCILVSRISGGGVAKPESFDKDAIMADAKKLGYGDKLDYYATLTGKVIEIDSPYDKNYGNISVIMQVKGYENYPIICYRMKSGNADVSKVCVGDTITVRGVLENYKGSLEFGTGCTLQERQSGGGVAKPESSDQAQILADAAKLGQGQKLSYFANLTGKVTSIDSPYDKNYGNMSVYIKVGSTTMLCYRLKSGAYDVSKVCVGDTITVRGVIENYKGSIQFGTGSTLENRISGGGVAKPESSNQSQILADAAKLGQGQKLSYYANLTGKVTSIDTPYDKEYGNISVYIDVAGTSMLCYRLKSGAYDASKIAVGDTITVRGVIENYKGAVQFGSGSTLEYRKSGGGSAQAESSDQNKILADAAKLGEGEKLAYYSTLTGKVTKIDTPYDKEYGNISVYIDVAGNSLLCYRLKSGAYDASKIAVGDTITVRGVIENYKGSVQFGSGSTLQKRVSGGGVAKPESSDQAQILADAAKLAQGEKLDYYATLTGKVTILDTPYDSEYGNISVYIELSDGTSMLCYRMKSGAADASKVAVGDTIIVRGVIENYKGAVQMGNGSTLQKRISGGGVAKPESSDQAQILADAAKLAQGEKLDYYATLTGEVLKIVQWYDPSYGNVSVDIELSDGTVLYCYRMKSGKADASEVRPGDTITVRGIMENYKGDVQMGTGCTLQKLVKGVNPGDSMTTAEIMAAAFALAKDTSLEGAYTLTGVISSVDTPYSSQYKNITVTMKVAGYESKPIQCYRLAKGAVDVAGLKVGDTITVYGSIVNYNGKVQFNQGSVLIDLVAGPESGPEIPDGSVSIDMTDKANRVSLNDEQQVWKQNGITFTNDKAGSTNAIADYAPIRCYKGSSITVAYPQLTRIIFKMATYQDKDYAAELVNSILNREDIVITREGLYVTVDLKAAADSFTVDALANQVRFEMITVCTGTEAPEGGNNLGGGGNSGSGGTASGYGTFTKTPEVGKAYKLGLDQTAKGATYYFIGTMSTYYGATETDYAQAVDVYLENATGGYYLYFMEGTTKQYVYIVASGTHINFTYSPSNKSVFVFDETLASLYTTLNGTVYYMGTYDNYVTVGTTSQSNAASSYVTHLYTSATGGTPVGGSGNGGSGSTTTPPEIPEGSPVLEFKDVANRVSFSGEQQVWKQNGITATNNLGTSGNPIADYVDPIRMYQGTELIVEYPGMTRIVFEVGTYTGKDYASDLVKSMTGMTGIVVSKHETYVTVDLYEAVDSFTIAAMAYQVRLKSITVCTGTTPPEGGNEGGGNSGNVTPADGYTFVDVPEEGKAYKFGMFLTPLGDDNYYLTGEVDEKYGLTTTSAAEAKDLYLIKNGSGYSIYYLDGETMMFMDILPRESDNTKVRVVFKTAGAQNPTIYTMNTEHKYLTTTVNGVEWTIGTYTNSKDSVTYTTMSASKADFLSDPSVIGVTQFPAWFLEPGEGGSGGSGDDNQQVELTGKKVVADFATLGFDKNQGTYTDLALSSDGKITMDTAKAYVKAHVRLYINAQAAEGESYLIVKSADAANGLIVNGFYATGACKVKVSGSNDNGANWTELQTYTVSNTEAQDFSFGNGTTYTWFKVEIVKNSAETAQLRIPAITVVLPEE